MIEEPVKELGSDFDDFRESIINGTFVEEFNMPQKQVDILSAEELQGKISEILPTLINNDNSLNEIYKLSKDKSDSIYQLLIDIYERHLNRNVVDAERAILIHALHILFYRMYYKTFSAICKVRYKRLCNFEQIKKLHSLGRDYSRVKVQYLPAYSDIPNSNLQRFPLVELSRFAKDVDFDVVVYDTYDYLDKLIGFKLSDIYYAAFKVNYEKTDDERALVFANLIKYGTSDEKEIYMIRYGLTLDDINTLEPFIDNIDATGITVLPEFYNLSEDVKKPLERFV